MLTSRERKFLVTVYILCVFSVQIKINKYKHEYFKSSEFKKFVILSGNDINLIKLVDYNFLVICCAISGRYIKSK